MFRALSARMENRAPATSEILINDMVITYKGHSGDVATDYSDLQKTKPNPKSIRWIHGLRALQL